MYAQRRVRQERRGCGKEVVRVDVGGPQCAYVKNARRMSSIYHNMINLVFSIEISGSPSRLMDIMVLESGASDNHVLCGSEGYQSEANVACFLVQTVCRLLGQEYLLSPWGICYTELRVCHKRHHWLCHHYPPLAHGKCKANVKIFYLSEIPAHCKATPEFVPRSVATIVDITGCEMFLSLTCPSHFLKSSNISFIIFENSFQLRNSTGSVNRSYISGTDSQIVGLNSFAGRGRHQNRSLSEANFLFSLQCWFSWQLSKPAHNLRT